MRWIIVALNQTKFKLFFICNLKFVDVYVNSSTRAKKLLIFYFNSIMSVFMNIIKF